MGATHAVRQIDFGVYSLSESEPDEIGRDGLLVARAECRVGHIGQHRRWPHARGFGDHWGLKRVEEDILYSLHILHLGWDVDW
jgi:hypothetical protein